MLLEVAVRGDGYVALMRSGVMELPDVELAEVDSLLFVVECPMFSSITVIAYGDLGVGRTVFRIEFKVMRAAGFAR